MGENKEPGLSSGDDTARYTAGFAVLGLGRKRMANVDIEARPKGRREGEPIDDYVVEDHADHVLATFKTKRRQSPGPRAKATIPLSHGSDI